MAENLLIHTGNKEEKYRELLPQLQALVSSETNRIANLANIAAALKQTFHFFWVGFYLVEGNELVLAPFQGPIACTRIRFGRGVCGTAWKEAQTLIVPDVEQFPGHIACSSDSKSEIVVPIIKEGNVIGVLDIDSDTPDSFDETDARYLEEICTYIGSFSLYCTARIKQRLCSRRSEPLFAINRAFVCTKQRLRFFTSPLLLFPFPETTEVACGGK